MTGENGRISVLCMAERGALLAMSGEKVAVFSCSGGMVGLSAVGGFSVLVEAPGGSVIRGRCVGRG
jgi:hypothetical protein